MRCWRLTNERFAEHAFDGEGAAAWGGRWNRPGVPVIYAADSQALAVLEVLVHADPDEFPLRFVMASLEVPAEVAIEQVEAEALPPGWRNVPSPPALADFGSSWAASMRTAVLSVPSAVIPAERNYLINPAHPDLARLVIGKPEPFTFDPRLVARR